MSYEETLDFLMNRLPMFTRVGSSAFKKDLTNTIALCEALENPQEQFKSIHVGGTNGKGSVSHMLAAVFQTAGYKTGLYTSPHLTDFRERIRINGAMIDKDFVVDFVARTKPLIPEIEPSFFELTVALAFDYFAKEKVDIAIIEVGLGGRLDSTNIITPELSVITNIGWDHMNMLGDTLPEIAREKAGIIKPFVPVVIGAHQEETDAVFLEAAKNNNAPLYFAQDCISIKHFHWNELLEIEVGIRNETKNYKLDLQGIYQTKNIVTVLKALDLLKDKWEIKEAAIQTGLASVKWLTGLKGRWDVLQKEPMVVLEVAHNKDGILQMLRHIKTVSYRSLHFVFGMVKDKDVASVLSLFPQQAHYYFTQAAIPRALEASALKIKAAENKLQGESFPDVNTALQEALNRSHKNDLIIVCGSIFLVAEVNWPVMANLEM